MLLLFFRWCCLFFFFKQKTAYEVRISDWSSDVCSSDLLQPPVGFDIPQRRGAHRVVAAVERQVDTVRSLAVAKAEYGAELRVESAEIFLQRSEEHTSELQSLMRISYAVFCLKKKQNTRTRVTKRKQTHKTQSITT